MPVGVPQAGQNRAASGRFVPQARQVASIAEPQAGQKRIPGILIAVVGATLVVGAFDLGERHGVAVLGALPQGQPERAARVVSMLDQQDAEGFGGCTNIGECAAVCPAGVPLETISQLNFDLRRSMTPSRRH